MLQLPRVDHCHDSLENKTDLVSSFLNLQRQKGSTFSLLAWLKWTRHLEQAHVLPKFSSPSVSAPLALLRAGPELNSPRRGQARRRRRGTPGFQGCNSESSSVSAQSTSVTGQEFTWKGLHELWLEFTKLQSLSSKVFHNGFNVLTLKKKVTVGLRRHRTTERVQTRENQRRSDTQFTLKSWSLPLTKGALVIK